MDLRGVVLDVDGTLVDSNDAHARSWVDVFTMYGYSVSFEQIRSLIGKGGDKLLPEAIGVEKESAEGKKLSKERSALFRETYLPALKPTRGARELLVRMREERLTLVVASSANEDELCALLRLVDAEDLVKDTTSSDDAKRSKPDPDIVQVALQRLGCAPQQAVMLGDTPYDIEAAQRANLRIVAFRCGGWDDRALAGALAVYDDPADLLARYDDSPLARR
jgi:HAD superfamily hydrolase (TIGR01509 family)